MTIATPEATVSEPRPDEPAPADEPRGGFGWGWVPAVLVVAFAVAVLLAYGVSPSAIARFGAYVAAAIALPGTLLWRALRGGPGPLVADVAAGTVLGYAVEVLTYIPARAVGLPLLTLAVQGGIIVAFLAVPGLRRFWRGSGQRVPVWWAWLVAGGAAFMVTWTALSFYRTHGLGEPANASPYIDMPFHLALAGEVKHHVPPVLPNVQGQPLNYHWFVYADMGATSWATGLELQGLLFRFTLLPAVGLIAVLIAVLAYTITRRWWTGPAALAITLFAVVPSPYRWTDAPMSEGSILGVLWVSPTQTFGAALFLPLVLVLVELLRGGLDRRAAAGRWALLAVILAAVTGAKATFLPILLGALAVVLVGSALARRLNRPALAAFGLALLALGFAQVVLFAGSDGGLAVEPLRTVRQAVFANVTGLTGGPDRVYLGPLLFGLALCLLCWACIWAGAFGLLRSREALADPAHLLCLGIGAAGIGAALVLAHPGQSQLYFFQSVRPYLSLLAVAGLAVAVPVAQQRPRTLWLVPPALLVGMAGVGALRMTGDPKPPTRAREGGGAGLVWALAEPFLVLVVLAAAVALVLFLVRRRLPALGALALPAVLVLATGFALYEAKDRFAPTFAAAARHGWHDVLPGTAPATPPGAVTAGRWLRDNSSPDDLVATNAHCRLGPRQSPCDNRHFWVSGFTERRVLVEGWGYTPGAFASSTRSGVALAAVPFWDPQRLADNDAVFQTPSAAAVDRLHRVYGVRWLFVDMHYSTPPITLDQFAVRRFTAGDCAVYELR